MTLVDSSVWIDYFLGVVSPEPDKLDKSASELKCEHGLVFTPYSELCPPYRAFTSLLRGRSAPFDIHRFALRWSTPEHTYVI